MTMSTTPASVVREGDDESVNPSGTEAPGPHDRRAREHAPKDAPRPEIADIAAQGYDLTVEERKAASPGTLACCTRWGPTR